MKIRLPRKLKKKVKKAFGDDSVHNLRFDVYNKVMKKIKRRYLKKMFNQDQRFYNEELFKLLDNCFDSEVKRMKDLNTPLTSMKVTTSFQPYGYNVL